MRESGDEDAVRLARQDVGQDVGQKRRTGAEFIPRPSSPPEVSKPIWPGWILPLFA
ncbi:hypothetical protein QRX45_013260 [Brucella abortus]